MLNRRQVISGALSLAGSGLAGCAPFLPPGTALCPNDTQYTSSTTPLTIDTHCHVFNGSDIQVEKYISLVRARETPVLEHLGEILQDVGWEVAPNADEELAALRQISRQLAAGCGIGGVDQIVFPYKARQYVRGAQALKGALESAERRLRNQPRAQGADIVADAIRSLPEDHIQFRDLFQRRQLRSSRQNAVRAAIVFVLQQFHYRYINVLDYLSHYSSGPSRKIDLLVCHLLDFDWALAGGNPTKTSIQDQVDAMEQISILTGGRVHCFAPFDPMKQVAFNLGLTTESSLGLVQKAITSQGFIGVKMYPPMGFAPMGNASLPPSLWQQKWVAPALKRPDLGHQLDFALLQLYQWCLTNNVPIMAHTSKSNGPSDDFEALTAADYWKGVPPGLTVTFGHFGDTEVGVNDLKRAKAYMKLMQTAGQHGANFYADSAYFTHAITNPANLKNALRELLKTAPSPGSAPLGRRLMYGSDWEMLIIEGGNTPGYLSTFEKLFSDLEQDPAVGAEAGLSGRFFGTNAVDHLSLRSGIPNSTRSRLDAFYLARNVPKPIWAKKVDMLPSVVA